MISKKEQANSLAMAMPSKMEFCEETIRRNAKIGFIADGQLNHSILSSVFYGYNVYKR